jgi:hypothetical protein
MLLGWVTMRHSCVLGLTLNLEQHNKEDEVEDGEEDDKDEEDEEDEEDKDDEVYFSVAVVDVPLTVMPVGHVCTLIKCRQVVVAQTDGGEYEAIIYILLYLVLRVATIGVV